MAEDNDKNIFIGARTLDKDEVKIIVPTYDAITNRIEDIRREASNYSESNQANKSTNKKYNNTITVFGERGTGKTSTMYTVINQLNKSKDNIVLDIIEPDNIGQEGKIIGCILGLFDEKIKRVETEIKDRKPKEGIIKDNFFRDCKFVENNPLRQAYNEVLEYYCYTEKDYRTLLTSNYNDMNSYIKKSSFLLNADLEFAKKFEAFIDKYIKYYKESRIAKKDRDAEDDSESNEPLIFIFIDDVDLNTSKCQEIIEAILKYAAHPNIVCFISSDYNTFNEAFVLSLLRREQLNHSNLSLVDKPINANTILESKQKLADAYMKKVFPPAYRHYVNSWGLPLRPLYSFGIQNKDKKNVDEKNLFDLLSELSKKRAIENIFGYDSQIKEERFYFLSAYNMFDNTARGLVNVYYSLWNFVNNLGHYSEEEVYFIQAKNLIDTILDSNNILSKYNVEIKSKYILWGRSEKQSKIDFMKLNSLFMDREAQENISKDSYSVEIKYALFYICYYISILMPNIDYSEESRRDAFKKAMLELTNNPKLSGDNIDKKPSNLTMNFFNNDIDILKTGMLWPYDTNFQKFSSELLAEFTLGFAQRFYKNIIVSKELGYDIFWDGNISGIIQVDALFMSFYNSLYKDINKDCILLIDFYKSTRLRKYINVLHRKSDEPEKIHSINKIFEKMFEGFYKRLYGKFEQQKEEEIDTIEQVLIIKGKISKKSNKLEPLFEKEPEEVTEIREKYYKNRNEFAILAKDLVSVIRSELIMSDRYDEFNKIISNTINIYEGKKSEENNVEREKSLYENIEQFKNSTKKFKDYDEVDLLGFIEKDNYRNLFKLICKVYQSKYSEGENVKIQGLNTNMLDWTSGVLFEFFERKWVSLFLNSITVTGEYELEFTLDTQFDTIEIDITDDEIDKRKDDLLSYNYRDEEGRNIKEVVGDILNTHSLSLYKYSELKNTLIHFYYNNKEFYGKNEAKELLDALEYNITGKVTNKAFVNCFDKWLLQGYILLVESIKSEEIESVEYKKAKKHLSDVLAKVKERQREEEREYFSKMIMDFELK